MADIRIKDLATTAASTASDDYIAIDGSANGTRKLNAYSPTFGGNLTVSGTAGTGKLTVSSANIRLSNSYYLTGNLVAGTEIALIGRNNSDKVAVDPDGYGITTGGAATIGGNLTVSGTDLSSVGGAFKVFGSGTFTGSGLELQYVSGSTTSNLRSYNRTGGAYLPLSIDGLPLVINGGSGGGVQICPTIGNVLIGTTTDGGQKLQVSGTAAISGALSIGNTVQTAVSVASTHKVTISIGGSTYYLLATNV